MERVIDDSRKSLAGYYAMIENLDWNVGRVLETVEAQGLSDNTYVIYFSDHGDMHGSHGRILKCVPFEESIRIPFVVRGPKARTTKDTKSLNGKTSLELINHVDIAPTSLGLCGIDAPDWMVGFDYSGCYVESREEPNELPVSAYLQLVDPGFEFGFAPDRERPWRGILTNDGWKYAVLEGVP